MCLIVDRVDLVSTASTSHEYRAFDPTIDVAPRGLKIKLKDEI